MTSAIRFACGNARMHALRSTLWGPADRPMLLQAGSDPAGQPLSGAFAALFPPLVRWYVTLMAAYPSAHTLFLSLARLHEVENLKLLWRTATRKRRPITGCWRPLEPLATLSLSDTVSSAEALVGELTGTPYGPIAHAVLRGHAADLPAAEIGFDRWAAGVVHREALRLPANERAARELLVSLLRERDVDLLRRGSSTFGLAPDLVAKSTIVLLTECRLASLVRTAAWQPSEGALWRALPATLVRQAGEVADWDALVLTLRRARLRACRRAFVGWPFRLVPPVAALLLREEQVRVAISVSAARARSGTGNALTLAMAASAVEP